MSDTSVSKWELQDLFDGILAFARKTNEESNMVERYQIITNKVQCLECGEIIESTHRHDFKWCKCKTVAVDGGTNYLKRTSNGRWKELSETKIISIESSDEKII